MRALVLAMTLVAIPAAARADGEVTVTLTPDGEALAAELGVSADELAALAEARIDEAYYVTRTDVLLRAFADASAFSGHGLGVDYGSNPDGLMFGVAANIAVAVGDLGAGEAEAEHPVAGVAANLSLMGGINLARFGYEAWTAYGNAFHRTGSYEQLSGSISTMGVHLQYRMTRPDEDLGSLVLQWGGLSFTAGLQAGRWSYGLTDTLESDFAVEGTGGAASVHLESEGELKLETFSITAPVEVSTSLRFLYIVSFYVGAGLDLQLGSSRLEADLDGVLTADRGDGTITEMGTAQMTIDGESRPSRGMLREMVGLQVNAWKLKAFVQLNAMLVRAASVAVGLRVVL